MNIVIIGATSAIAKAVARRYAIYGACFVLLARDEQALNDLTHDLLVRGAESVTFEVADFSSEACLPALERALCKCNHIDLAIIAHGVLGEQSVYQDDITALQKMLYINGVGPVTMLTMLANTFEAQARGTIAFISSVAGDRGRASNYAYGASKALVNTFLQGMRARLSRVGVNVLTIKPGFVDTPMTANIRQKGALWAQPEDIAKGIEKAVKQGKAVVYLPSFWRVIMWVIRSLPHAIFNRLKL